MLKLESEYWQAIKDKDVEAAQRMTAEPCIVAGATGAAWVDGKMFAQIMKGADWKLESFQLTDLLVRAIGDDVWVVAYGVYEDLTVAGQPVSMGRRRLRLGAQEAGTCALHTESLLGDAYGCDRKAGK